jgi:hypothetical protein
MPEPQELQAVILLALIPVMIAAMYSVVQITEALRTRGKPRANMHPGSAMPLNRRLSAGDQ